MPEVKFMAKDTALAMDEVERKLGADALILSMERRDGMIEIIATNDPDRVEEAMERSQKKKQGQKVDVETEDNSLNFSEELEAKKKNYSVEQGLESKEFEFDSAMARIKADLQVMSDATIKLISERETFIPAEAELKILGFSQKSAQILLGRASESSKIRDLAKDFARSLVCGKSKHFDASEIILVCGPKSSGKTILAKKLAIFLPELIENQVNKIICDPLTGDLEAALRSNDQSNITSLFRKKQNLNMSGQRIILDYEGPIEVLSSVLLKLDRLANKPKVSVVYALEVGKSYNAVKASLDRLDLPEMSVALTKMDLFDVSIAELSAISDCDQKVQFFSGLKIIDDGLDFAKVSVLENFLDNLIVQEGL
tara:strand:- start:4811 stop:5917 length:1107 start_codon:yes stop_codon:yes gene_type:complete